MPNAFGDRQKNVAELSEKLIASIDESLRRSIMCCVNCSHFDNEHELCTAAKPAPARPPARVIAFGCEFFLDVIPF